MNEIRKLSYEWMSAQHEEANFLAVKKKERNKTMHPHENEGRDENLFFLPKRGRERGINMTDCHIH